MKMFFFRARYGVTLALWLAAALAAAQTPWSDSYRLEAQGDYAAALSALRPVIDADPTHELAIMRTAWLQYLLGDYNSAIDDYERAAELNEQSLDARLGMLLPLLAQRRWREAAVIAQEVLSTAPWNYYAHVRLMVAEEGQRQWETLARHAHDVAARYPSDATVLVYLARAEARQGNLGPARRAYTQVLERYPAHEEALAFLSQNAD